MKIIKVKSQKAPPVFSAGETSPNRFDWAGKVKT